MSDATTEISADALDALEGGALLSLRLDARGLALELDIAPAEGGDPLTIRLEGLTGLHLSGLDESRAADQVIFGAALFKAGDQDRVQGWRATALEDAVELLGYETPAQAFAKGARVFCLDPEDQAPLIVARADRVTIAPAAAGA